MRRRGWLAAAAGIGALQACDQPHTLSSDADSGRPLTDEKPPEFVYQRGPQVQVEVRVRAERDQAAVNDWITLYATRRITGDWQRVRLAGLPEGTPWLSAPPPAFEAEVAANLRWFTDPQGASRMDVPTLATASLMTRKVRFERPGVYRLWARSHYPIDGESNVLTLTVK